VDTASASMRLPRIVRRVRRVRRGSGAQRWEDVVDGDRDLDLDRVHIGQRVDPGRYPVPEATGQGVQIDPDEIATVLEGDGDLASKLRELGAALDKRYEGDVRRIREDAGQDPARERALLGELPGTDDSARGALGPIGTTRPPQPRP